MSRSPKRINFTEQQEQMTQMFSRLKNRSIEINRQLNKQKETRTSLYDYLDKGGQVLKKTNEVLKQLKGMKCFGCNLLLLIGVVVFTLFVLALL